MTDGAAHPGAATSAGRFGGALQSLAFALLLACVAARPFLAEMPFRTSALRGAARGGQIITLPVDRTDLARVTFPAAILAAGALWLCGAGLAGALKIRHGWLVALAGAFAAWSFASAWCASDKRTAMTVWLEQAALLAAGVLAVQMCADRRRFAMLVAVLAAVGIAVAAKAYWQVAVEVPQRVADFQSDPAGRLASLGIRPGTPEAKLFESRLRNPAPFGFFNLANMFASLLIVLVAAAAGLAIDAVAAVRGARGEGPKQRGQINPAVLAAVLAVLAAVGTAAVLPLTRSRGALIGAAAAVISAGAAFLIGRQLARHRRRWMLAGAVAFLLVAGAVAAFGMKYDRLPTRTMTFRWFYWTGAAEVIRRRPMLGVGPGNFPAAYLRHRRPEAEEAVKTPHNIILHAFAQYGLVGGLLYLAAVAYVLGGACCKGDRTDALPPPTRAGPPVRPVGMLAAVAAAVFAARAIFADMAVDPALLIIEATLPAIVLAAALALCAWAAGLFGSGEPTVSARARVVLICGLGGFLLHNMITFSLWTPATALVFWTAAGACLAGTAARQWDLSRLRWPAAVAAVAAAVAAAVLLVRPVYTRSRLTEQILRSSGTLSGKADLAVRAAQADTLDPIAADDAARMLSAAAYTKSANTDQCLAQAERWARAAIARDPAGPGHYRLAAEIAARRDIAKAVELMRQAMQRNGQDSRLRLQYAEMLMDAARPGECLRQLRSAEQIDATLRSRFPDSVQLLSPRERQVVEALRAHAKRASPRPKQ